MKRSLKMTLANFAMRKMATIAQVIGLTQSLWRPLCRRTLSVGATTSCISSSAPKTPAPRSHPHRRARLSQHKIIGNSRCVVLHVSPVTRRGAARGGSNWTNPTPPGRSDAVCEVSHDRARQCRGKRQLGTFETWCASVSICDGDKFMLLMFAPSN